MKKAVLRLVPEPPSVITAEEIAKRASLGRGKFPRSFRTGIQKYLRDFREEGLARSMPLGGGHQLGWHLLNSTQPDATTTFEAKQTTLSAKSDRLPPASTGVQEKVQELLAASPLAMTAHSLAKLIEKSCHLASGEAQKTVETQLLHLRRANIIRPVPTDRPHELAWRINCKS